MGSHSLFFYGTLLHPPILHRVIHGPANPSFPNPSSSYISTQPAVLPDHRRHRVKGADYPAVVPVPRAAGRSDAAHATPSGSSVRGTLATGLTDMDVRRLDIFEGDEYSRLPVRVRALRPRGPQAGSVGGAAQGPTGAVKGGSSDAVAENEPEPAEEEADGDVEESELIDAETYIWIAGARRLEDAEWDFAAFKKEKMRFWIDDATGMEGETGKEEFGAVDGTGGRRIGGEISRELEKEQRRDAAAEMVESAV